MNELSKAIEQAVQDCKETDCARVKVNDVINNNIITITAEWVMFADETCEGNDCSVIEVYVTINGIPALSYAVKETLTEL